MSETENAIVGAAGSSVGAVARPPPEAGAAFPAVRGTGITAAAKRLETEAVEMQDRTEEVGMTKVNYEMSISLDGFVTAATHLRYRVLNGGRNS